VVTTTTYIPSFRPTLVGSEEGSLDSTVEGFGSFQTNPRGVGGATSTERWSTITVSDQPSWGRRDAPRATTLFA